MTRIDVDQLNAITSPPQRATEVFRSEGRWITALRDVPDIRKPGPRIPQRPVNRGGGAPRARDHFSPDA
jgi:hypothetical protein